MEELLIGHANEQANSFYAYQKNWRTQLAPFESTIKWSINL
jgi:hypothetical protein